MAVKEAEVVEVLPGEPEDSGKSVDDTDLKAPDTTAN
jgi:hypothetical protein